MNRNKTLKELHSKRRMRLSITKVPFRDWVYSYGINRPKTFKKFNFNVGEEAKL